MITLHTMGPKFGQPDPSPFVVKAIMLLKMSGVQHDIKMASYSKAPKGKVPYIETGNGLLGDSFFIARFLEAKHGVDFSGSYDPEELAKAWAIARMLEEHLYFLIVHDRWIPDDNFSNGPANYFNSAPFFLRGFIRNMIRSKVRKALQAQGMARHTNEERLQLARGDVDAVEILLGNRSFILGNKISECDATVFAFLFAAGSSHFNSRMGDDIRARPKIMAYLERIRSVYFPEAKL